MRIPKQRRHTLLFLREVRPFAPVFLDTEVDMTAVLAHRAAAGKRYSLVSYVLRAAGEVLARHPEANAAVRGTRIAHYPAVHGKLTLDKHIDGCRVVLSTVVEDVDTAGLEEIQRQVERHRDSDPATMPDYAGVRLLHRVPGPVAGVLYRLGVRPLGRRPRVFGTVAVTSLGHRAVDSFHSVGGTTVTLGVGRVLDRPVAADGAVAVAPVMRLSLAFDHRVIDGAEAADVLTEIKQALESCLERPETDEAAAAEAAR
ncbi:2-oxo acid dehydrogenase subunit E2 [Amycolatopsis sp. NPDC004079]|uniref:2-oxo acid dehydrogenase subunit E2 n=1 Tax=Amycolatopsis sp. NPDC004079 TaxID=3154549 RepID=UPI0033AD9290